MKQYIWDELDAVQREDLLRRPALAEDDRLQSDVARILDRVRRGRDSALFEITKELDGVELDSLRVGDDEFKAAETLLTDLQRQAMAEAAANIRKFHEAQLPAPVVVETAPGVVCERVTRAD